MKTTKLILKLMLILSGLGLFALAVIMHDVLSIFFIIIGIDLILMAIFNKSLII